MPWKNGWTWATFAIKETLILFCSGSTFVYLLLTTIGSDHSTEISHIFDKQKSQVLSELAAGATALAVAKGVAMSTPILQHKLTSTTKLQPHLIILVGPFSICKSGTLTTVYVFKVKSSAFYEISYIQVIFTFQNSQNIVALGQLTSESDSDTSKAICLEFRRWSSHTDAWKLSPSLG